MDLSTLERQQEVERMRLLLNFQRNPTWKKVEQVLRDRRDQLELTVGQTGLSDADRACLHGKLALCLELLFHVPIQVVDRDIADRSPSPEADDPPASLPDPARTPEIF